MKPGKWLKSLLTGKGGKEKEKCSSKLFSSPVDTPRPSVSQAVPKEKKRWSFRRARNAGKDSNGNSEVIVAVQVHENLEAENEQKKTGMTAKSSRNEATGAQQSTATRMLPVITIASTRTDEIEVAAAITIQAFFRTFLARKALNALKGLVKLQALVRGHLVRKHATETLRCMQALIAVQARAREQRLTMLIEAQRASQWQQPAERPVWLPYYEEYNDIDSSIEEHIKTIVMDNGAMHNKMMGKNGAYSSMQTQKDERNNAWLRDRTPTKNHNFGQQASPTQSTLTEMSPRTYTAHFNKFSFINAQSNNQNRQKQTSNIHSNGRSSLVNSQNDCVIFPSYMADTESSRAKARSQSAPKQRPSDAFEKPISRKRALVDDRRSSRTQKSASHVSSAVNGHHFLSSIKLDRSNTSLVSSCSTSTIHTNTRYRKTLVM